ncbi:hypothetical protein Y1Q_0008469 [Alligator mississippiensis]|uniref:Uncharacterized protein n=1 Tax=Alligator mississippiensis TaxID=8496 RepID=A0A151M1E0_ALLMI|nr:hypothetical protein Y1Q_0008469 [Alligator mississippiensis]
MRVLSTKCRAPAQHYSITTSLSAEIPPVENWVAYTCIRASASLVRVTQTFQYDIVTGTAVHDSSKEQPTYKNGLLSVDEKLKNKDIIHGTECTIPPKNSQLT